MGEISASGTNELAKAWHAILRDGSKLQKRMNHEESRSPNSIQSMLPTAGSGNLVFPAACSVGSIPMHLSVRFFATAARTAAVEQNHTSNSARKRSPAAMVSWTRLGAGPPVTSRRVTQACMEQAS